MGKILSEMSLEELWQLFPIFLTEHQPHWEDWYREECEQLQHHLPATVKISHIGSTAIPSIWAKPIVDILVEIPQEHDLIDYKPRILNCGYICIAQHNDRLSFNKGYTDAGFAEKVFHLHLLCSGDHDELFFRDYLIEHPDIASDYEALKLSLWRAYEHDRDGYTNAKAEFVRRCTEQAKTLYRDRY